MIKHIEFVRFRGFERLRADLTPHAYIVGPNSAGKSTVLEAIGLAERCLRIARRKAASLVVLRNGRRLRAYSMPANIDNEEDPVRHDFGRSETRVSVHWAGGGRVHLIWPDENDEREGDESSYFYIDEEDGAPARGVMTTRALFNPITIIPVVTPIDRFEELKNPTYVETQSGTRLASRHFRNHAWLMWRNGHWSPFKEFCQNWLPEIDLLDVSLDAAANRLAVFYSETGSRVPKELAWAGDGIQIWVQLLWHLFRASGAATIVLDEPEVYLHPDLQRRLVRLLDGLSAQIILASHSAEVISEAPPDSILWVDRRMGGARRARSHQTLSALSSSLGSSYNLALARSMRARLVVAADCEDVRVIRQLAKQVGATNLANEQLVSIVQLREVSNWAGNRGLGSSLREVLPPTLPAVALLSAGHRPQSVNKRIVENLAAPRITVRFWERAEIENYLLDADAIARVSGAAPESIDARIVEACSELREATRAAFIAAWVGAAEEGFGRDAVLQAETTFDTVWSEETKRVEIVRGTLVINALNHWLDSGGYRLVTAHALARAIRPQSLHADVLTLLHGIDDLAH